MEVKQETFGNYNLLVDKALAKSAWADPACVSWYKVGATGKVGNNSPWSLEEYCERVRRLNLGDYNTVSRSPGIFSPSSRRKDSSHFCRSESQILTRTVASSRPA